MPGVREDGALEVRLFASKERLVAAVAVAVLEAVRRANRANWALGLTGGRVGGEVLQTLRESHGANELLWEKVDWWWGDERFLPAGHPARNETQARKALLGHIAIDECRVHTMPAADGAKAGNLAAATAAYADQVSRYFPDGSAGGRRGLDMLLLSMGEDGHVASLFPGHSALDSNQLVAEVTDSPKPPALRVTHTLPFLNSSRHVLLMASGAEKAGALAAVLSGTEPGLPAARVEGRDSTVWFVDRDAASVLVPSFSASEVSGESVNPSERGAR